MKSLLISQKSIVVLLAAIVCVFTLHDHSEAQTEITGPWLWMIAPTETGRGGADSTDVDSLAVASGGAVTEADVATNGATEGDIVGNYGWTLGVLNENGDISRTLYDIGMTENRYLDDFSSYALITLVSETDQTGVTMHTGSDDSIKVWLNGENVFTNATNRGRSRWQDNFQVNLKKGDNLLLVKVSQRASGWGMYVGIDADVTLKVPTRLGIPVETPDDDEVNVPGEITGPWLWMIAPTETGRGGADSTDVDSLAIASGGAVTEADVAANGATEGDIVGNYAWTLGTIRGAPINYAGEIDNVTDVLKRIGWTDSGVLDHSSYALITLESAMAHDNVTMSVGSDDSIKVWLNGEEVYKNPIDRGSGGYQDTFSVNLKQGENLLLVKVSQGWGNWTMFVGIDADVTQKVPARLSTPTVPVETPIGQYIYWADVGGTDKIQRSNLDGSDVQELISDLERPTGIALDMSGGKIYWTETDKSRVFNIIKRANLDGTNIETLLTGEEAVKEGIVLDTIEGKMYWVEWNESDHNGNKIQRANLDGTHVEDLVTLPLYADVDHGGLPGPRDIALDLSQGKMYWTNCGEGKIQRSNLDGTNIEDLVTGLGCPYHIDLNFSENKMYWTHWKSGKIQRADFNGTNLEDIVVGLGLPTGIALDMLNSKIYWADRRYDMIQRSNLDGTNIEDVVTGLEGPFGIALSIPMETTVPIKEEIPYVDATVSLSPAPSESPRVGEQLMLNLNVAGGENITGYQATVQFDETALRYVSSDNADYLLPDTYTATPIVKGNTVTIAATSLAGETNGDGILATLTFDVISEEVSTVTLTEVLFSDSEGMLTRPHLEPAELIITPKPALPAWDVNEDGHVNILDMVLVGQNIGGPIAAVPRADVNGDGSINILDLVLVAGHFGESTNVAAPDSVVKLEGVDPALVEKWLELAQLENDGSLMFQQGIANLERLLASLIPRETALLANYPNPFNPETWMPYQLAKSAEVSVYIYAADGKLVRTLTLGHQAAGVYHNRIRAAYWDGKNGAGESVASGVYFYTFTAGDFTATRKMLILK